jgi:hypothetical protein
MSLKAFLNEQTPFMERLDRVLYSGSLLDKITIAHTRTGDRKSAIRKRVQPFWNNIPTFGEYIKLSDKESFYDEVKNLYEETNK